MPSVRSALQSNIWLEHSKKKKRVKTSEKQYLGTSNKSVLV